MHSTMWRGNPRIVSTEIEVGFISTIDDAWPDLTDLKSDADLEPEYHQTFLGFVRSAGREGRSIVTKDDFLLTSTYCKRWRACLTGSFSQVRRGWFLMRASNWSHKEEVAT